MAWPVESFQITSQVIQRRGDYGLPRENFSVNWRDYKLGFGQLDREFWFGNDFIHRSCCSLYLSLFHLDADCQLFFTGWLTSTTSSCAWNCGISTTGTSTPITNRSGKRMRRSADWRDKRWDHSPQKTKKRRGESSNWSGRQKLLIPWQQKRQAIDVSCCRCLLFYLYMRIYWRKSKATSPRMMMTP